MAEKDASARLRRAVKENNLFLVKRLIQRTEMRNPDPTTRRYTSLAWAAVLGNEETFEYLLAEGHDDDELSRDAENNTIFMLLADQKAPTSGAYPYHQDAVDTAAAVRMARMYYDRYADTLPDILDWSNSLGRTALHIASLKGNEELVRMFCDLGADMDLADNKGNTSLHYASSWGHIPIVQLLIERGCQYSARNNENFTASDYAYSFSTRDTLQDAARLQYENNKRSRSRNVLAQAQAARGTDGVSDNMSTIMSNSPARQRSMGHNEPRLRADSGRSTSNSTTSSVDTALHSAALPGTHQPSTSTSSLQLPTNSRPRQISTHSVRPSLPGLFSQPSSQSRPPASNSVSSQIVNRMRERDADAIEKYMNRNRSGSASTDTKSQNGSFTSAGPSANGDDINQLRTFPKSGTTTPRRLRPSMSASQLRIDPGKGSYVSQQANPEARTRAGTNPSTARPSLSPNANHTSHSGSRSITSLDHSVFEEPENFTGPPSQYASFPEPPAAFDQESTPTVNSRRIGFHILSKASLDSTNGQDRSGHRRGMSSTSLRSG